MLSNRYTQVTPKNTVKSSTWFTHLFAFTALALQQIISLDKKKRNLASSVRYISA